MIYISWGFYAPSDGVKSFQDGNFIVKVSWGNYSNPSFCVHQPLEPFEQPFQSGGFGWWRLVFRIPTNLRDLFWFQRPRWSNFPVSLLNDNGRLQGYKKKSLEKQNMGTKISTKHFCQQPHWGYLPVSLRKKIPLSPRDLQLCQTFLQGLLHLEAGKRAQRGMEENLVDSLCIAGVIILPTQTMHHFKGNPLKMT